MDNPRGREEELSPQVSLKDAYTVFGLWIVDVDLWIVVVDMWIVDFHSFFVWFGLDAKTKEFVRAEVFSQGKS